MVKEFNKLSQENEVKDCIERFEELESLMTVMNPALPESYYISNFISWLKDDVKLMLKILKPSSLMQAFEEAKWQEESNANYVKKK